MKSPFAVHQSVYFALGILIMKSVSLIMLPIVTYYLSPAQFGDLELLLSISDFASILIGFGMSEALYRFAGLSQSKEDEARVAGTIFTVTIFSGAFAFIIGMVGAPFLLPYLGGEITLTDLRILVFLFAVDGLIVSPLAWLKLKENAFTFFVLTTGKAIIQAILTWQLLKADFGISAILIAGAVSSVVLVFVLFKMQYDDTGIQLDTKRLPEIMIYGAPLVVSYVAAFALLSADRWVISAVATQEELGLYALAKKLAFIIFILMQPFWLWWAALRFKTLNGEGGKEEVAKVTSFGIALTAIFAALVLIGSPIVMDLFINESFAGAMVFLPPLAILFAGKLMGEMANLGCYVGKTTYSVMTIDLVSAGVSVLGMYLLSEPFGIDGVIAALLIAQAVRMASFYFVSQRVLYLNYAKGKLMGLFAICIGLSYVSLQIDNLIQHFIMVTVATITLLVYVHYSGLYSFKPLIDKVMQRIKPAPIA